MLHSTTPFFIGAGLGLALTLASSAPSVRAAGADVAVEYHLGSGPGPRDLVVFAGDRVIWDTTPVGYPYVIRGLEGDFNSGILSAPTNTYAFVYDRPGTFAYEGFRPTGSPPYVSPEPFLLARGVVEVLPPPSDRPEVFLNSPAPSSPLLVWRNSSGDRAYAPVPLQASVLSTNGLLRMEYRYDSEIVAVATNWPFRVYGSIGQAGKVAVTATAVYASGRTVTSPVKIIEAIETDDWRGRLGAPSLVRPGFCLVPYQLPQWGGRWLLLGRSGVPFSSDSSTNVFQAYLIGFSLSSGRFPLPTTEPQQFLFFDRRF